MLNDRDNATGLVQSRRTRRLRAGLWAGAVAVAVLAVGTSVVIVASRSRPGPDVLRTQAQQAVAAQDWKRAEVILDRLAARRAPTTFERLLRAEIARGLGRDDEAMTILQAIPDADPLAAQARQLAGSIERRRGRMRPAEAALREALRLDPGLIPARRELVFVLGMQARRAELNEQIRELAARIPLGQSELFLWTTSNIDIWINEAIRDDLEAYLAADPADRWSRLALAGVLLHQGDLDGAEATLAPLSVEDIEARALRARIALDRSRPDDARALLAGAPEDHAGIACVRAKLALRAGDRAEAARQFETAARLDPTSLEAAQGLALALGQLGRADEAAQALAHAKRLRTLSALLERAHSPDGRKDKTLPRRLAAACEAIGQTAEAKGWYQLAVNLDPLDQEAQQALFRLQGDER